MANCKYCGEDGLYWKNLGTEREKKFRLFHDAACTDQHDCPARGENGELARQTASPARVGVQPQTAEELESGVSLFRLEQMLNTLIRGQKELKEMLQGVI